MKKVTIIFIIIFAAFFSNAQELLDGPQKIIIDKKRNRYLVSNFYSGGDLILIDSVGIQDTFVANAGMVDGMQIIADTVYGSAFGGRIKGYDLETGSPVVNMDFSGDGVQFLSGLVTDSEGFLYASERFGTRIFKINPATRDYWVFASGNGIDQPNGMLYEETKNRILVCLDKTNPPILAISLVDSSVSVVVNTTLGGSDGIAKDADGNYYVTGYYLPGIYKFDSDFNMETELFYHGQYIVYPTYNENHNSLLVTLYEQDEWLEIPLGPSSVSTGEIQKDFTLNNNYPNPFNPSTKITYSLKQQGFVTLTVFNVKGEKVATLVNEFQPSGNFEVEFSAIGGSASGGNAYTLPSGIYFYKLQAGNFIESKKMVLIK